MLLNRIYTEFFVSLRKKEKFDCYSQWTWCGVIPFGHRASDHQTFKPNLELS